MFLMGRGIMSRLGVGWGWMVMIYFMVLGKAL
jgi:hypothetical protein